RWQPGGRVPAADVEADLVIRALEQPPQLGLLLRSGERLRDGRQVGLDDAETAQLLERRLAARHWHPVRRRPDLPQRAQPGWPPGGGSGGTMLRLMRSVPRSRSTVAATTTRSAVSRRRRSSIPAVGWPSKPISTSPETTAARSAGLPGSTWTTKIPLSACKRWKRTTRRGSGTVWPAIPT